MSISNKKVAKAKLSELIDRYNSTLRGINRNDISEETIRTWLNELLAIFGWDVQNTSQVLQERVLSGQQAKKLREISSTHKKPDYTLMNGTNIKTFLDAKSLDVNIFTSKETAFQIRSYGWSAQSPCAFVSNFEQFVIYDTRFIPSPEQKADMGTVQYSIDEYIDNFDTLYDHLYHDNICSNHLEYLYKTKATEGNNQLDSNFMLMLSEFRIKLAKRLLKLNRVVINNDSLLNYYVQVILDRIIFIRVCESKEIEKHEKLKHFLSDKNGFWNSFKNSCYMEFYNHYDGAMFKRDELFQSLNLDNSVFVEFINELYYPFPYRFDVIPVKVIANIYEEFLGKQLVINNGRIEEVTKSEYVKTNGAVCTPEHIVDMICKQTFNLSTVTTIRDAFKIKVLDPCCGSGVFAVSAYELLTKKIIEILSSNADERNKFKDYYFIQNDNYMLTIKGRRAIVTNCIHGIDYDEAAIEVTKMSLALKIVDGNNPLAWNGIGAFGDKILRDIDRNIKLGNSLVSTDNHIPSKYISDIKPFDIKIAFSDVFTHNNGFSYIIGNPPYVETKHYKAAQPLMHDYLSRKYYAFEGKADLAVLFIEKCISLLSPNGKIGFIIQRRWFKTDYGRSIRALINQGKYLEKLIDFKATNIFKGRMTYVSIMVLSKRKNKSVQYFFMPFESDEIKTIFENSDDNGNFESCDFSLLPIKSGTENWSYEYYQIEEIKNRLSETCGVLGEYPKLSIKDGIQALWKKMYHLTDCYINGKNIIGKNGFKETVEVEKDAVRAVIYNREFYPFKKVEPDAYCIFPYTKGSYDIIPFSELKKRFPLLSGYLSDNKKLITKQVECYDGDFWHRFTREHNHTLYNVDKIIIPMTARDTIATFINDKGLYMDNANVWFITVKDASADLMKAITCIINSTIFTVLGKSGANPQSGGYYKFNKQFLMPIPFPVNAVTEKAECVKVLAKYYSEISELQEKYLSSTFNTKEIVAGKLRQLWAELDDICYNLYKITDREKQQIINIGRTVSRIDLLNGVK
ncbi:N-6 DNA methylase [Ruminococcus sp.]|uniref:Eco57I restriction-modification methylase domain-containing protein n=1 Tax=Ruminococcus sp. TaxID=41978 RepID=UPI0025F09902|nr:N-6 DNA methylase [Ruminococcus sp.]